MSNPKEIELGEGPDLVFSLWHPDHPGFALDLFVQEPFDFDAAYGRALSVPLQDV